MNAKFRSIYVDEETAALLQARAEARNLTIAELIADLAGQDAGLPAGLADQKAAGSGPWDPRVLAEDERRLMAFRETREGVDWAETRDWLQNWGENDVHAPPPVRKL